MVFRSSGEVTVTSCTVLVFIVNSFQRGNANSGLILERSIFRPPGLKQKKLVFKV